MEQTKNTVEYTKHRTVGNRVFDLLVYPSIAFGGVFAFSVWALHTTKYGNGRAHAFFEGTNKSLADKLVHIPFFQKMSPHKRTQEASNYASILVSFAAGTILVSPIKWLEDRREKIARHLDRMFGSAPQNPTHYLKEPKQTWQSIYGGRALTFASVLALGTAIGEKRTAKVTQSAVDIVSKNWSKIRPSSSEATLAKVKQWTEVSAFETFYTSLCAVLVYVTSRGLADMFGKYREVQLPAKTGVSVDDSYPPAEISKMPGRHAESYAANRRAADTALSHTENVTFSRLKKDETSAPAFTI